MKPEAQVFSEICKSVESWVAWAAFCFSRRSGERAQGPHVRAMVNQEGNMSFLLYPPSTRALNFFFEFR